MRKFYIDILMHSVINPCMSLAPAEMERSIFLQQFATQHGSFSHLQVCKVNEYVRNSEGFCLDDCLFKQTQTGAQMATEWFANLNKSNSENYSGAANVHHLSPLSGSTSNEGSSRTTHWVKEAKENLPVSSRFADTELNVLHRLSNDFGSHYALFLLTSKLQPSSQLREIARIPWLKVIDFDVNSRKEGLLSCVENTLKSKRSYTITASTEQFKPVSERATDWYFPLGFTDRPDTVFEGKALQWFFTAKKILEQHCLEMSDFCICQSQPYFLILWYSSDNNDTQFLDLFLSVLYPAFMSDNLATKFLICIEDYPAPVSALHQLISKYQLDESIIQASLSTVCKCLSQLKITTLPTPGSIRLPQASVEENQTKTTVEISDELLWIQQFIEILPLENLDETPQSSLKDAGKEFVKGGIIKWEEIRSGSIAVDREAQSEVLSGLIRDVVNEGRTVVFKILHAPGGGGTTFARQLLWYLHSEVSCGVVLPSSALPITQLIERVEFLYEKTILPVVLLVDGRSDHEVEELYESCKYAVVILHVQRYNGDMPSHFDEVSRTCYLPGSVTLREANKLTKVFSAFSPDSKTALEELTKEVKFQDKFIFEYGLTAFNHEFKGVRKYVNGYMELHDKGLQMKDLLPWQKVVAYLSLVLYYSQGGLHRETFRCLLSLPAYGVRLEYLEYSGRQFIVDSNREWKISYYMVAKEILEQVLSRATVPEDQCKRTLSKAACGNLHELVLEFISMLQEAVSGSSGERIIQKLTDVILRRNYRDMDMSDVYGKRHSFSRLLEDVPDDENRIKILKTLTEAFPDYTEFHAHFGRLLNRMGKFIEAEKELQTALATHIKLKGRLSRNQGRLDNDRGRIHHMFGFACLRWAKNELSKLERQDNSVENVIRRVMPHANKAIHHFMEGRKYVTYNRSYGYIGEVRARLLIAEHVHKEHQDGCQGAFNGKLQNVKLSEFIRESHSTCDQLLAECQRYTSEAELRRIDDFYPCVEKFTVCFKNVTSRLPIWKEYKSNIPMRRSQIVSLKMRHHPQGVKKMPCVDTITSKADLKEIINLYESTFQETVYHDYRLEISLDILEWLDAIRHCLIDDTYTLVKLLPTFEAWERRNEIGYATYYLYVIYYVLSIYSPGTRLNMEYNNKSKDLRQKLRMQQHRLINTRLSREWLASHDEITIRKLICRNRLGVWDKDTRFWKESENIKDLQVCTGTVIKCAHARSGIISLDVPRRSSQYQVEVYFVPVIYDLVGNRYSDQSTRVEFFIGFSAERGAEALSIRILKRSTCHSCGSNTEMITLNQDGKEKCSKCHYCR